MNRRDRGTQFQRKQLLLMGIISLLMTIFLTIIFIYLGAKNNMPMTQETAASVKETKSDVQSDNLESTDNGNNQHEPISLSFAGDVLLDRSVGEIIKSKGAGYPFESTANLFQSSDIAALNLETSVSTRGNPAADKQFTFRSHPDTLQGLKSAGIDVVSLANNHTMDFGIDALQDTMSYLDDYQIGWTGAGKNEEEAFSAHYIDVKGKKIAILGLSRVLPEASWFARGDKPGIAHAYETEPMMSHVKKAVSKSDYTIVMIHWNKELQDYPEIYAREMGRMFVDAGVDAVIGSHSHCLQGIEYYNEVPIYYSLGNFIFTKSGDPRGRETMIVKMTIDEKKGISTSVVPAQIVDGQPRLMDDAFNQTIFKKLSNISYNVTVDNSGNIIQEK